MLSLAREAQEVHGLSHEYANHKHMQIGQSVNFNLEIGTGCS
jgi:hypothetical protein